MAEEIVIFPIMFALFGFVVCTIFSNLPTRKGSGLPVII